jgi:hypothetical protein
MTNLSLFADSAPTLASATTIVNFRDVKAHWNAATQTWDDPRYIYIGRANPTHHLPASPWANPYKLDRDTPQERERVIGQYAADLTKRLQDSGERARLEALRGKILVCWCSPKRCHGHALADALDAASTPLRIVPREVQFPPTWRPESIAWARARQMTQAQVDSIEAELVAFRAIRDRYRISPTIQEKTA